MKKIKRVAVVTKRKNIADFFLLEAKVCSIIAEQMWEPPEDISPYDAIIIDSVCGYTLPVIGECRTIRLVEDREKGEREDVWELPISIKKLRAFYVCGYDDDHQNGETTIKSDRVIYILDQKERSLVYKNRKITLTEGEWRLLMRLWQGGGDCVSRQELRDLFGADSGNISDVYICHLRKKLEEPFGVKLISTERGKGYALKAEIKNI